MSTKTTPDQHRDEFLQVRSAETHDQAFPGTWAQQAFWDAMKALGEDDHQFNLSQSVDIGGDISAAEAFEAVAWMVRRHESFRTLFFEDSEGRVTQQVQGTVEVPVRVLESDADADQTDAETEWVSRRFRHVSEIPLRVCLIGLDGGPKRLVLSISHMCADLFGIRIAIGELTDVLGGANPLSFPCPVQPREVAEFQNSDEGKTFSDRAVAYWIRTLLDLPAMRVDPGFSDHREPRFWQGQLSSGSLPRALTLLSSRFGVSSSVVLLSAASLVLGELTGTTRPSLMLMCGNRINAADRRNVSPRVLEGLFTVNVSCDGFAELLKRTWRSSLTSYRHSQYNKVDLLSEIQSSGADRCRLHRTVFYNDARMGGSESPVTAEWPTDEALRPGECDVRALTDNRGEEDIALHVHDDGDRLRMTFTADTELVGPQAIEDSLREIERIILRAVKHCRRS
ncbi:hypothetical protein GCM10010420_36560 [Streptomyces glaucosporus]|uniref:Condensation domain-containing protein n=1 Tax=Streptomyces glaucosporus TaxID=284044 RepID=A0ABN3IHZ5_9ACTN